MTQRRSTRTTTWVQALGGGKDLAYLPAVAFTAAAVSFLWQARRSARARSED